MNPAIDDSNVYIGNLKGELFSFNKITGKLNWKSSLDGVLNSTPLITKNRIIITNLFKSFSIIDKENGVIKNTYSLDGRGKLSPILIDNKLIIGYDDGMVRAYEFVY
jgi:outer membrane protein assembly factor BamB